MIRAPGRVLDRPADQPRLPRHPDRLGNRLRIVSEAVLQIRAYRQIGSCRDRPHVSHHLFAAHRVVPLSERERIPRARRRQGFEAEVSKKPRRANVPGVWDDEGVVAVVKGAERCCFFCLGLHLEPPA
jgi:hypothetical protein